MPSAGSSHFYTKKEDLLALLKDMCQCPRRALLISTVKNED